MIGLGVRHLRVTAVTVLLGRRGLGCARWSFRWAEVIRDGLTSTVQSALANPHGQVSRADAGRVEAHGGGVVERVGIDAEDTVMPAEDSFNGGLLTGPLDPVELENHSSTRRSADP